MSERGRPVLGGPICYGVTHMTHETTELLQSAEERIQALGGYL
ncbi:MAG TPA: hypothetical protein VK939_04795 [Longimicrobiales bacterium]|nr:hypothetical protein [Longimicrobiales bacterium]